MSNLYLAQAAAEWLAAPNPSPTPETGPTGIDTSGILAFILQFIVPIIIAIIGVVVLARAKNGKMSEVMTSVAITMIGVVLLGSAVALPFIGDDLANVLFK